MKLKPDFLDTPAAYTRTKRTDQSRIDAACAVEHCRAKRSYGGWLLILAAVVAWGLL